MLPDSERQSLSKSAFMSIADLAHRECGLKIRPEKILMVQSRLRRRLRALNLKSFEEYSDLVQSKEGQDERGLMISALTTNVSHFFREPHHFELLSKLLIPKIRKKIEIGEQVRIWSAGCSKGQEPYSIAIELLHHLPDLANADFKILATDIDPSILSFAQKASFPKRLLSGVPHRFKAKFHKGESDVWRVSEDVYQCVYFRQLNLIEKWPMKHRFDAVFCRNVMIYFDTDTQKRLWPRFHGSLLNHGLLFLGHSERIPDSHSLGFSSVGPTAYEKIGHMPSERV